MCNVSVGECVLCACVACLCLCLLFLLYELSLCVIRVSE